MHREALETRMAEDVEHFYGGVRAPLSEVTAAAYCSGKRDDGSSAAVR